MLVCVGCGTEMQCLENGVGLDFGMGHVYPSDTFRCGICGVVIAYSEGRSTHDEDHKAHKTYIKMKGELHGKG